MYGIYVNTNERDYACMIAFGEKTIETRNRNTLGKLVGERVAIISTRRNRPPLIMGYATITEAMHVNQNEYEEYRTKTRIERGSVYDCKRNGKWLYFLTDPKFRLKYVPNNAIRHGRSYIEFEEE